MLAQRVRPPCPQSGNLQDEADLRRATARITHSSATPANRQPTVTDTRAAMTAGSTADLRSADRRGRRLSRSREVQRRRRATDMPAVDRKAAGRQCAVRADLPGLCQRPRRCMRPQIPGLAPGGLGPHPHVLRYPCGLSSGFPFARRALPLRPPSPVSLRPAFSGSVPSAAARFRFPFRLPAGFPSLSNLHVSAAAGRFRRRRSRAAGDQGHQSCRDHLAWITRVLSQEKVPVVMG